MTKILDAHFGKAIVPALLLLLPAALPAKPPVSTAADAMMLPDRQFTCNLGHATNLDITRQQSVDEIVFDSHHILSLRLAAAPARKTPPPDATEPAEPVNKATRIIADPDGLTSDTVGPFSRVVDLWPDRVEMTMPMDKGVSKLLILSDYDADAGTARLFMTDALDLATFDLKRTYMGDCTVRLAGGSTGGV